MWKYTDYYLHINRVATMYFYVPLLLRFASPYNNYDPFTFTRYILLLPLRLFPND